MDTVVVVEREDTASDLWLYGEADPDGQIRRDVRRLRYDPDTGVGEPLDPPGMHFPTAALLARSASTDDTRLEWNITAMMFPPSPPPPPVPPGGTHDWQRSTAGRTKAPGRTLAERAEQARRARGRSAA